MFVVRVSCAFCFGYISTLFSIFFNSQFIQFDCYTGKSGEFFLVVTNLFGNTTFYGYDGWRFYETKVQPTDPIFENAHSIFFHLHLDSPMFIVKNEKNGVNFTKNYYQASFMKTFPKYELLESTLKAVQETNRTVYKDLLPKAKLFNASYDAVKNDIVYVDQDINITGMLYFKNAI